MTLPKVLNILVGFHLHANELSVVLNILLFSTIGLFVYSRLKKKYKYFFVIPLVLLIVIYGFVGWGVYYDQIGGKI
jgi:energy-coupling factor transporter transmembrane protein EcfT